MGGAVRQGYVFRRDTITMFWTTAAAFTAATAIVSGTWGLVEPVTVPGVAHAADVTVACWVEKADSLDTAEVIYGDESHRPKAGTASVGVTFYPHADPLDGAREPWVLVREGNGSCVIEPSSTN